MVGRSDIRTPAVAGSRSSGRSLHGQMGLGMLCKVMAIMVVACLVIGVEARSPHPPPLKRVHHPSRSSLEILPRKRWTPDRRSIPTPPHPASLLFSDTVVLSLDLPTLLPYQPVMLLRPTENLFHPDARITYPDGKFERLRPQDFRLYQGDVIHPDWVDRVRSEEEMGLRMPGDSRGVIGKARVMVHYADHEPIWEGGFNIDGVDYHVLTKDKYMRTKSPHDAAVDEIGHNMVVFRTDEVDHDHASFATDLNPAQHSLCSHDRLEYNSNMTNPVFRPHAPGLPYMSPDGIFKRQTGGDTGGMAGGSNFVNSIGDDSGCPDTQRIVYMGVALDCNYVTTYGSTDDARTQVLNVWNQASALYRQTFSISLGINELVVQDATCPDSTPSDAPWNVHCNNDLTLDERLSRFSQWRGDRSSDNLGLWHLMTACPTDTEVGVAWLGTLCQTTSTQQRGSVVSGTGVSTASRTEWTLVAHEVGHNFGAIHDCTRGCSLQQSCCPASSSSCDAGGQYIMNPTTSSSESEFSPCSIGNICSLLGTRTTSDSCLVDPGSRTTIALQQCGNGIVDRDDGEECDPGFNSTSACCDPETCRFREGAVCDPQNDGCCTDQCQVASSGTVCRASRDDICDREETCDGSNVDCPADETADDGTDCGDGLQCASGVCTSLDQQCRQSGNSMNLTQACGQKNDESCVVSCRDPQNSNQCVVLQTPLVDGSPCGYGGHCYNATCQSGPWQDRFEAMYTQNLQISIPVTIVVGIIILLILFFLLRCIFRACGCCGGRGGRSGRSRNSRVVPPMGPPPQHPSMRQSQYANNPPPPPPARISRHSDSVRSGDPITGTNVYSRNPSPGDYNYYGNGNGNGYGGQGPQYNGWVDESQYNGPYYGRQEAYGR